MSRKRNVRQEELKERLGDMIELAIDYVKQNGYEHDINVKEFLADYRTQCYVGFYASQRYFADFCTIEWFRKHKSGKTFRVESDVEVRAKIKAKYGITMPEPKEKPKAEVNQK